MKYIRKEFHKYYFLSINVVLIIFFIFFTAPIPIDADANYSWTRIMGGTSYDEGWSVDVDSSGNVYTTGTFQGTADFDPGIGINNITSVGSNDIFVSKLDSNGDFLWAKSVGGTASDVVRQSFIDSSGNVYVAGFFQDTVDFDPGAETSNLTSAGGREIFLLKLDSNGDFLWVKSVGSTGWDETWSLYIDSSNNIYIAGAFSGTVDFDPGVGESNLTSLGNADVFVSKLDSNGDFLWAKSVGSTGWDMGISLYLDSLGNIYTTGYFSGTVDFDPGVGESNLTSLGSDDIFISKLDSSGNFVWAKSFGGTNNDYAYSIFLDSSGNVYTTGYFQDTVDFDPGVGESNLTSMGTGDIFISKLDSSGNFLWAKSIGGTGWDYGFSINSNNISNIYISGWFQNTVDFDPGVGESNLTSVGSDDIFISKLDSSGNFVWAKSFGGTNGDISRSVFLDSSGNIYTAGRFQTTVDFDPGAGTSNLTSAGSSDIFISKLSQAPLISEITPVGVIVNNNPISYTFTTDEPGTITYGGSCSSATTVATAGNNTITLNSLIAGTYSNCTITVTDGLNNVSNVLTISLFDIVVHSGGGSSTPSTPTTPVITTPTITTEITPIQTPALTNTNSVNNNTDQNQTTLGNNKLCTKELILTQNLKVGARDNRYHSYTKGIVKEVKILQTHMNRLGFNSGKVDGILGPITDGAIKRMQAYLGTKEDGLVGPITRGLINNSCDKNNL